MYISEDIMKRVAAKEEENENFNRCLNVKICPKCGADLEIKDIGGGDTKYTCHTCLFTHTRFEA